MADQVDYDFLDELITRLYNAWMKGRVINVYKLCRERNFSVQAEENDELDDVDGKFIQTVRMYHQKLIDIGVAIPRATQGTNWGVCITSLGREIHQSGGYQKWRAEKVRHINEEQENRRQEVSATKASAVSSKSSSVAAWVAAVFALVSIVVSVIQSYSKDKEIEALEDRISKIEEGRAAIPTNKADTISTILHNDIKRTSPRVPGGNGKKAGGTEPKTR